MALIFLSPILLSQMDIVSIQGPGFSGLQHGRNASFGSQPDQHDFITGRSCETARESAERKRARDAAEKHLRRKMRGTVLLLSVALDPGDPRWLAFGLHIPKPRAAPRPRPTATAPAKAVPIAPMSPAPLQAVA